MISHAQPVTKAEDRNQFLLILLVFAFIHIPIFIFGLANHAPFMAGDRAGSRLEIIEYVFQLNNKTNADQTSIHLSEQANSSLISRIIETGYPGDYLVQGLLFSTGGTHLVIVFQLALSLLAVLMFFKLIMLLQPSSRVATLSALIYMILPGSLILPHQLAGEALFNPLMIIGFYFIVRYFESRPSIIFLLTGLFFITLTIFVRQQMLLYPFLLITLVILLGRQSVKRDVTCIVAICIAIPMGWTLFQQSQSSQFSLGNQSVTVSSGFGETAKRMQVIGRLDNDDSQSIPDEFSPVEFLGFIADHPVAFIKLKAGEVTNLFLNSGSYSVATHHFGLFSGAGDTTFWKSLRDQKNLLAIAQEVLNRGPLLVLVVFGGTFLWGLVLIGSCLGGYYFYREASVSTLSKATLFSLLIFSLTIVLIASDVRWGHRTPVEFFIVFLFVFYLNRRRSVSPANEAHSSAQRTA